MIKYLKYKNQNKNGFTLVELIVYLAIMIFISNMAMVSLDFIERQKLVSEARILKNNLEYCQLNAISEKRKYELIIDEEKSFYYIKHAGDNNISKINLQPGIKISCNASDKCIAYTERGTIVSACTIKLEGKKYFLELTTNVSCGRVKIKDIKKSY